MPGTVADHIKSFNNRAQQAKQESQPRVLPLQPAQQKPIGPVQSLSSVSAGGSSQKGPTQEVIPGQAPTQPGDSIKPAPAASRLPRPSPQTPGFATSRILVNNGYNPPSAPAPVDQAVQSTPSESYGRRSTQIFQSPATRRRSRAWEPQLGQNSIDLITATASPPRGTHPEHLEHSSGIKNVIGRKPCPHHKHAAKETAVSTVTPAKETSTTNNVENISQSGTLMSPRAKFARLNAKEERVGPGLDSTGKVGCERSGIETSILNSKAPEANTAPLAGQSQTQQPKPSSVPAVSERPTTALKVENRPQVPDSSRITDVTEGLGSIIQKSTSMNQNAEVGQKKGERASEAATDIHEPPTLSSTSSTGNAASEMQTMSSHPTPVTVATSTTSPPESRVAGQTIEQSNGEVIRGVDPKVTSTFSPTGDPATTILSEQQKRQSCETVAPATLSLAASVVSEPVVPTVARADTTKSDPPHAVQVLSERAIPPLVPITKLAPVSRAAPAISEIELSVQNDAQAKDNGIRSGQCIESSSPVSDIKITGLLSHEKSIDDADPTSIPSFYAKETTICLNPRGDETRAGTMPEASFTAGSKDKRNNDIETAIRALDEIVIEHRAALEDVSSRLSLGRTRLRADLQNINLADNGELKQGSPATEKAVSELQKQSALLTQLLGLIEASMADWDKSYKSNRGPTVSERADREQHLRALSLRHLQIAIPAPLRRATSTPDLSQPSSSHTLFFEPVSAAEILPLGCPNSKRLVFPMCRVTVFACARTPRREKYRQSSLEWADDSSIWDAYGSS